MSDYLNVNFRDEALDLPDVFVIGALDDDDLDDEAEADDTPERKLQIGIGLLEDLDTDGSDDDNETGAITPAL